MAGSKRCPECGTPVKVANLAEHYGRVHPRAKLALSREEQAEIGRASARRDRPALHANRRVLAAILIVLAVIGAGAGAWWVVQSRSGPPAAGRIQVSPAVWYFGDIDQSLQTHVFQVQNVGTTPLRLDGISTSCMCTSADLTYMGSTSPRFGQHENPPWSLTMLPGAAGTLAVYYDPTVHPEFGHFQRDIYILSSDPAQREVVVTIHATEV